MVFRWFKKKPAPRVEPVAPAPMSVMALPPARYFADEAGRSLGYLKPDAVDMVVSFMGDELVVHPRETATGYRKRGEQIADDEKKALGIRKNAFMSRRALEDLTDKGRARPLDAHEVTTLRATFAMTRNRNIRQANELGYDEFEISSTGDGRCAACDALDGKVVKGADAPIFPRPGVSATLDGTCCRCRSIFWPSSGPIRVNVHLTRSHFIRSAMALGKRS